MIQLLDTASEDQTKAPRLEPRTSSLTALAYIDGSRAVYRISLSFRGPQMNRCRLIDEVSVYLQDRSNCHITLLYKSLKVSLSCLVSVAWQLHSLEE